MIVERAWLGVEYPSTSLHARDSFMRKHYCLVIVVSDFPTCRIIENGCVSCVFPVHDERLWNTLSSNCRQMKFHPNHERRDIDSSTRRMGGDT